MAHKGGGAVPLVRGRRPRRPSCCVLNNQPMTVGYFGKLGSLATFSGSDENSSALLRNRGAFTIVLIISDYGALSALRLP
jgi:hypothetical protein